MLGLPTEARAGLPIARTQLGEYDGGNGYGNAAKFYDELDVIFDRSSVCGLPIGTPVAAERYGAFSLRQSPSSPSFTNRLVHFGTIALSMFDIQWAMRLAQRPPNS